MNNRDLMFLFLGIMLGGSFVTFVGFIPSLIYMIEYDEKLEEFRKEYGTEPIAITPWVQTTPHPRCDNNSIANYTLWAIRGHTSFEPVNYGMIQSERQNHIGEQEIPIQIDMYKPIEWGYFVHQVNPKYFVDVETTLDQNILRDYITVEFIDLHKNGTKSFFFKVNATGQEMKIADELQDKAMGIKSLGWEQDPAIDIHFIGNCLD